MLAQAGQRDPIKWADGVWNRVTGQRGLYRRDFEARELERLYQIHGEALVLNVWRNEDRHQEPRIKFM